MPTWLEYEQEADDADEYFEKEKIIAIKLLKQKIQKIKSILSI